MAQLLQFAWNQSSVVVAPVTTAETVILVSNPVEVPTGAFMALIQASLSMTLGTGTTGVTLRVRRGSTATGTQVEGSGNITSGVTAGSNWLEQLQAVDQPLLGDQVQYCITYQAAGATANAASLSESIAVWIF